MTHIQSFPPIAGPAADRLILGSMPGKASLQAQQYYAHPRNSFWRIMEAVLGVPASLPYAERCLALAASGVAVWDVLQACTRSSSLDSDIVESSIVANDLATFLTRYPGIRTLYFNGRKAEAIFRRHLLPRLAGHPAELDTVALPSTSPANASLPVAEKIARWRVIADPRTSSGS
ncbi:DNA-deoxyinosine glycosylase [Kineobactrum salinum]|uniref:DNA-deoxyinosine glycosylase n=1 Tax=Kineobactrum salinum TaxID=2708301 RepID=A0A6C0TYI2_9GAMM|nr:DNA-deoxyinosine glycosylase [Kineobactrum salinum]QIB64449.1 DNA-deoxyinosine glycosylase [Kineobactrum salinum]